MNENIEHANHKESWVENEEEITRINEKQEISDQDIDELVIKAKTQAETNKKIDAIYKELGIEPYNSKKEFQGNYSGDWTLLLQERMKHPASKEKFIAMKVALLESNAQYDKVGSLDLTKVEDTKKYHYDQIRNYDNRIDTAFSYTTYVPAREHGKKPEALGDNQENGTVFIDAIREGQPLSDQEKNTIEAHEKGHVIRDFKINTEDISKGFDFSKIPEDAVRPTYLRNPDELAERMSQLKNYFGFKGGEVFTRQHLAYAREKYFTDGKINNNMKDFFSLITPEKESEFLRIINTYPI